MKLYIGSREELLKREDAEYFNERVSVGYPTYESRYVRCFWPRLDQDGDLRIYMISILWKIGDGYNLCDVISGYDITNIYNNEENPLEGFEIYSKLVLDGRCSQMLLNSDDVILEITKEFEDIHYSPEFNFFVYSLQDKNNNLNMILDNFINNVKIYKDIEGKIQMAVPENIELVSSDYEEDEEGVE